MKNISVIRQISKIEKLQKKFILLGAVILFCVVNLLLYNILLFAQGPDTLWTKTFGGIHDDYGYSVAQTFDGGYIVAGQTQSFGARSSDVWLIKTDAKGDSLWAKTYG